MNSVLLLESVSDPRSAGHAMDELSQLPSRVARLESDVDCIKRDVADIKIDLRRMDDRLRGVDERLTGKIDALRDEFASAKIWALGLYFGLAASMLFVMAKGFKWI